MQYLLYAGWLLFLVAAYLLYKKIHENSELKVKMAGMEAREGESQKRFDEQKQHFKDSHNKLEQAFKALAVEALESHSESFLKLATERLDKKTVEAKGTFNQKVVEFQQLIDPIKKSMETIEKDINRVEKNRMEQFGKISQQLLSVTQSSDKLKEEASSLTQALRRPEVRGNWGEIQLRRVVELAGMSPYCDFEEQVTVRDSQKNLLKPDLVVRLPNERSVIIDSKAVLDAYLDSIEAKTPEQKELALARHAKNIRSRVQELSRKSYWDQFDDSPEFAVLFIPNEALLAAAVEVDRSIIEDSLQAKIIIATPTTLVALLKAIHYGWQHNKMAQNAQEIIKTAKDFYERLSSWLTKLDKVGSQIEGTMKTYNDSMATLERRVLPSARKLQKLGVSLEELPTASIEDIPTKREVPQLDTEI